MDGNSVTCALHELFESQVINHGDYSLVYAEPCGPGPALVLGYRHTSLELVLCPVQLVNLPRTRGDESRVAARLAGPISSIDLSNVATMADTGTGYQVHSVTGFHTGFEVEGSPRIAVDASPFESSDGAVIVQQDEAVIVQQDEAAEDFHQFMAHFMDVLDAFYQVPDVHEIVQDTYTPSLAA
ncbi:MAG: hypothetical protein QJR09_13050 [Micrococcus sp.]|nr:hypothetical protein [Micrococcus sp.]